MFMGAAPTGKQVTGSGMAISRVVKGKIVEEWEEWDSLGMMRQFGIVPPAAKVEAKVAA
jgi:predicted ester cyclase